MDHRVILLQSLLPQSLCVVGWPIATTGYGSAVLDSYLRVRQIRPAHLFDPRHSQSDSLWQTHRSTTRLTPRAETRARASLLCLRMVRYRCPCGRVSVTAS